MALHVETPLPRFRCEGFAYGRVSDTMRTGGAIRRIDCCRQLHGVSEVVVVILPNVIAAKLNL
jgi:hypothetical protein